MASDKTNRKLEYLDQGYAVRRNNQTLALQFALSPPSSTDAVPVLSLHSPYSRFVLTLIDLTGNERKIMKANIRADEVPYLLRQYELAIRGKYEFLLAHGGKDDTSGAVSNPAFKIQIRAGALKGRTPGEVLLEDPSKESELTRHRKWLEDNLGTYPKNQEVIDAINDALYLKSVGQLEKKEDGDISVSSMTLFKEDYKYMSSSSPTVKTGAKIAITCEYQDAFPWKIALENCEVPFEHGELDYNRATNRRKGTIHLSDKEMEYMIYKIGALMSQFENHMFAEAYDFVQKHAWTPST